MPLIQENWTAQNSTPIREMEIVRRLTDAVPPFEEEGMRSSWVTIEEICSPEWTIGGPATTK